MRAGISIKRKENREERKKLGLCVICKAKKEDTTKTLCKKCRDKTNKVQENGK
tara:strand:+ start:905 stop:1063 length:159 start_codon:yes stop_codon:yes gene_type:complete